MNRKSSSYILSTAFQDDEDSSDDERTMSASTSNSNIKVEEFMDRYNSKFMTQLFTMTQSSIQLMDYIKFKKMYITMLAEQLYTLYKQRQRHNGFIEEKKGEETILHRKIFQYKDMIELTTMMIDGMKEIVESESESIPTFFITEEIIQASAYYNSYRDLYKNRIEQKRIIIKVLRKCIEILLRERYGDELNEQEQTEISVVMNLLHKGFIDSLIDTLQQIQIQKSSTSSSKPSNKKCNPHHFCCSIQ